jgi:hypothetical protein
MRVARKNAQNRRGSGNVCTPEGNQDSCLSHGRQNFCESMAAHDFEIEDQETAASDSTALSLISTISTAFDVKHIF